MKRLHEGWDYRLYQIYIWGGLALIVVQILVSTLVFDALDLPGGQGFLVIIGPMLLWLAGILLYWWWVFLFKGSRELEKELSLAPGQGVPGIKALRSWSTLHQAMAVYGGNVDELVKNDKRARRPIIVWYGGLNLLAIWIIGPIVLGSLGLIPADAAEIWLVGIGVGLVLMLVGTPFLVGWGGRRAEDAYFAPLGLALTERPKLEADLIALIAGGQIPIPDGPATAEGERRGRLVHIEKMGRTSLTVVRAAVPAFGVQSGNGKLVADEGAPEAVTRALRSLRKAKRWRGIVAHAGPEGIGISRQSRGTNMWLYDLWLAEYLLHRLSTAETPMS